MISYQKKRPTGTHSHRVPVGRFAPSPTGNLHLGSLTTAIASYCHIKSLGGKWLLRIEDTDTQRCHPQYSSQILKDLHNLGLHWNGEVIYQSQRTDIYNELMYAKLGKRIYGCHCSRKQLQEHAIYPRFCLTEQAQRNNIENRTERKNNLEQKLNQLKVRVQLPDYQIGFLDRIQGRQWVNPQQSLGDVVLRRADGIINYFLAVSVDDGLQQITHVMRGLDILPLTTAQIALMQYLDLPAIEHWYHLPLVENKFGQKLSKQNLAQPIDTSSTEKCQKLIVLALELLRQPTVILDKPEVMLQQAILQWQNKPLKQQSTLGQFA